MARGHCASRLGFALYEDPETDTGVFFLRREKLVMGKMKWVKDSVVIK
jgi:hypothetical protein